ncbi:MAG: tetratricopeptide repeat protein [Cyanobacteria bacterium P01_G01_bin.39]
MQSDDLVIWVLNAISKNEDLEKIHNVFREQQNELNGRIAIFLWTWASETLPKHTPEMQRNIASDIVKLGDLFQSLPFGDEVVNLIIAITAYELAAQKVFTYDQFPKKWASIQNSLGTSYSRYRYSAGYEEFVSQLARQHEILCNLKSINPNPSSVKIAIGYHHKALDVFTRESFPYEWAKTMVHLSNAKQILYKNQNIWSNALENYTDALEVITPDRYPEEWVSIQLKIGNYYRDCQQNNRPRNIEIAINYYQKALEITSPKRNSQQWAEIQQNLGIALHQQGQTNEAIYCLKNALKIFTPEQMPIQCIKVAEDCGKIAFEGERWSDVIEVCQKAITAIEITRKFITKEQRRREIFADFISLYNLTIQAYINSNQLAEAIEFIGHSRSKQLNDLMASSCYDPSGDITQDERLEFVLNNSQRSIDDNHQWIRHLQEESPQFYNLTKMLHFDFSQGQDIFSFTAQQSEMLKKTYYETWRRFDYERFDYERFLKEEGIDKPLKLDEIQKLIEYSTTAILCFYTTQENTYIFVIRQNAISYHTCEGENFATLQRWIYQEWLELYNSGSFYNQWKNQIESFLTQLSQRLHFSNLIDRHLNGIEELVLLPYQFLHVIPFAALPISKKNGKTLYLNDQFSLRYISNFQLLHLCQKRFSV